MLALDDDIRQRRFDIIIITIFFFVVVRASPEPRKPHSREKRLAGGASKQNRRRARSRRAFGVGAFGDRGRRSVRVVDGAIHGVRDASVGVSAGASESTQFVGVG